MESTLKPTTPSVVIPKYKFSEPRHNLPGRKGIATAEDRFTIAFMRAYLEQVDSVHRNSRKTHLAFAREIPINGYGIADLHVVAWEDVGDETFDDVEGFVRGAHPCTRAFECKLTDWRKAMSQASRYRFFAHQPFVVLPETSCHRALAYLDTFKKIRVGLWSFSPETGKITVYHTPRAVAPKSERHYLQAIHLVAQTARKSLPFR